MRTSSPRFSLLGRFSAMGLVVVAALGLAIGLVLKRQIEHRAVERAVQQARVMAQFGVQPELGPEDLRWPNSLGRLRELDRRLAAPFFHENGLLRVKLFNSEERLVYSDDRALVGDFARTANVARSLRGEVLHHFEHGTDHDGTGQRVLEVYVPVRLGE